MADVAVIGNENFIVGFQLVGIHQAFTATEKPFEQMKTLMEDDTTSMVIVDEETMDKLNKYERNEIEDSADPVFLTLSKNSDDARMRKIIIEAVGVDIWDQK